MLDYDFRKLNDKEFEAFSVDLLSKHFNRRFERFKPGKDSGVDGRYFAANGDEVILQCKHWPESSVTALITHLRSKELPKLDRLKPKLYYFSTSLPLSRKNKDDIQAALYPWLKSPDAILGQEDLNGILGDHKDVEERHYKLWFSSVTILSRLQNVAIKGRSEFKIGEAKRFAPKYVVTAPHAEALDKLETIGTIIITGQAGIGKSTLAEQIALQYALKGFEICCIADSVEEAESVWQDSGHQLFYFDDFLGRNYIQALERHEDSHIVGLIKRVSADPKKKFILTSRTTVLNQGKSLTDLFVIENIDRSEYELKVERLTLLDKGRILYNHLFYGKLLAEYVDEFYENQRYLAISKHKNYNPRLIAFITDQHKVSSIPVERYWQYIEDTLRNPKDIWSHVFDQQLNEQTRILVRLVVFNGSDITETDLKEAFDRYIAEGQNGFSDRADLFSTAIRHAVGSVLNRNWDTITNVASFSLFNPSVGDFVTTRYKSSAIELANCLVSLLSETSLQNLRSLGSAKVIKPEVFEEVLSVLIDKFIGEPQIPFRYQLELARLFRFESAAPDKLKTFCRALLANQQNHTDIFDQCKLLEKALDAKIIESDDELWVDKIEDLAYYASDEEEFQMLSSLISNLPMDFGEEVTESFVKRYVTSLSDRIFESVYENGALDDFVTDEQLPEAVANLRKYVVGLTDELRISIPDEEITKIVEACDLDRIMDKNQQRSIDNYEPPTAPTPVGSDDIADLHDLFDRGS